MTDKERLEEIKKKCSEVTVLGYIDDIEIVGVDMKDLVWLIQQAEKREYWMKQHRKRANELEDAYFKIQLIEKQLHQAQAKAERYKQALENIIISPIPLEIDDAVNIARQALEGEE